ncbi:MAG: methylated-DNA--[protein]-cysteine S-methyltransferase [Methylophilaceae bacterium]|nr:methylated-DNA--[protein]-cysteine S-methyltransferase [Methylophilaceae bacterium]
MLKIQFALRACSLGWILVAASELGICAIFLGDDAEVLIHDLQGRFPQSNFIGGDQALEALMVKVVDFIEAPAMGLDLPLDIRGSAFQQKVWQALREIPAGETASYSDIAKKIGAPKAFRAVAQACAANALAVVIPCHRVVKSDGAISGYRWGVQRKITLLAREALKP